MLQILMKRLIVAGVTPILLSACSTIHSPSKEQFHDSALNDRNYAPRKLSPPSVMPDGNQSMDEVFLHSSADYYFTVAESYSLEGQHQLAIENFRQVLIYDPESSPVYVRLASEFLKLGMLNESLENALLASQKSPTNIEAHLLLGSLYSALKSYSKAIEEYNTVVKLDPQNTEAPLYLGAVYAEQKNYEKAVKYFQSLTQNENFTLPHIAYYYIGRLKLEQGGPHNETEAIQNFQQALKIKPSHFDSILALVSVYKKHNQDKKLVQLCLKYQQEHGPHPRIADLLSQHYLQSEQYDLAYEQLEVLESFPDEALNAKVRMALILLEKKNYEEAALKLQDILKEAPESDKIRFYLAAVYEEQKKDAKAIDEFLKIPADSSFYSEAIVHAAYLLKQKQKLDKAIQIVHESLEKRDDLPQLYAVYASLLDEKGQHPLALKWLEKGSEKFPQNIQIKFFLGTIQDKLGNKSQSIDHMKEVIELDPNYVQALNYLAYTYAEQNENLDQASDLAKRALQLTPNDGFVLDTYGWILYKKGKFDLAIRELEKAQQFQPEESIILEHLGDAYHKKQMINKAKQMYLRAAETESDKEKAQKIRNKILAVDNQLVKDPSRQPASEGTQAKEPNRDK